MLEGLERMLAKGVDNAMLRFGLGKAYLDREEPARAVEHLRRCVTFDPAYSAAWKLLGKALLAQGDLEGAKAAWQQGLGAAQGHGDKQAEKEIGVFLKRLERQQPGPHPG